MVGRVARLVHLVVILAAPMVAAQDGPPVPGRPSWDAWRPVDGAETGAGWRVAEDGLYLQVPPETTGEWDVEWTDALPDGPWQIEAWIVQLAETTSVELYIVFDRREDEDRYFELHVDPTGGWSQLRAELGNARGQLHVDSGRLVAGAGPVHRIRLGHSPATGAVTINVNGQSLEWEGEGARLPRSPVRLRGVVRTPRRRGVGLHVPSFAVSTETGDGRGVVRGIAHSGWATEPSRGGLGDPAALVDTLRALEAAPEATLAARAYALAAMLLCDTAVEGAPGERSWADTRAFLETNLEDDPNASSILLPIAVACASGTQRDQAEAWVHQHLANLPKAARKRGVPTEAVLRRAALLDPVAATMASLDHRLGLPLIRRLAAEVMPAGGDAALALYCARIAGDASALAWLLPDLANVSPGYADLAIEWLTFLGTERAGFPAKLDQWLSFAAYRLGPSRPARACALWELVESPDVRAETLLAMADDLAAHQMAGVDAAVEQALQRAIDEWEPRHREDTVVSEMIRLAEWYHSRNREDDAIAMLLQAGESAATAGLAKARDTVAIARAMGEMGLAEADEWWMRAGEAATAADAEFSGIEEAGTTFYLSGTRAVVAHLVEQDRLDEALAATRALNKARLPANFTGCMSRIIYALADQPGGMDRALELAWELPECRQRDSLAVGLARRASPTHPEGAKALAETLSGRQRVALAVRLAIEQEGAVPEEMSAQYGELLQGQVKYLADRRDKWDVRGSLLRELTAMPIDRLLALSEYLRGDLDYWAHQLLASVAHSAGVSDDPLWLRYDASEEFEQWQIPWGVSRLANAIRSEGN